MPFPQKSYLCKISSNCHVVQLSTPAHIPKILCILRQSYFHLCVNFYSAHNISEIGSICPPTDECIRKMWYMYTKECY